MTSSSSVPIPGQQVSGWLFRIFSIAYFLCLAAVIGYLWTLAQDRYATTAAFKISRQDISPVTTSLGSLGIPGVSDSNSADSQLAIGFIESADLLVWLEDELDLKAHYSSPKSDWFFRMDADEPLEKRLDYYRKQIVAKYDVETGLTMLTVESFEPEMAHRIAELVLKKSDEFINDLNREIADQKLSFIKLEAVRAESHVEDVRNEILAFQNEHNLIDPEQEVWRNLEAVQSLRMKRLSLDGNLKTYLRDSPESPRIDAIRSQLVSLDQQIEDELAKLSGEEQGRLNQLVSEYENLKQKLEFALQLRTSSELLMEKTRVDAAATSRFFSVIQRPYMPEDVSAPRHVYTSVSILVLGLFAFMIIRGLVKSTMERM